MQDRYPHELLTKELIKEARHLGGVRTCGLRNSQLYRELLST
jgi:hypothetical protein